ncbi:hypothetical protein Tco_0429466 [Tanacetum coccineum]
MTTKIKLSFESDAELNPEVSSKEQNHQTSNEVRFDRVLRSNVVHETFAQLCAPNDLPAIGYSLLPTVCASELLMEYVHTSLVGVSTPILKTLNAASTAGTSAFTHVDISPSGTGSITARSPQTTAIKNYESVLFSQCICGMRGSAACQASFMNCFFYADMQSDKTADTQMNVNVAVTDNSETITLSQHVQPRRGHATQRGTKSSQIQPLVLHVLMIAEHTKDLTFINATRYANIVVHCFGLKKSSQLILATQDLDIIKLGLAKAQLGHLLVVIDYLKVIEHLMAWSGTDLKMAKLLASAAICQKWGCYILVDYFINNDLEYLKGGSSSSKYATSTTRAKAAKYDNIDGIKDMVPTLWSPVKGAYNKHVVWGTRKIITVTNIKVMRWYDYGCLEEIVVRKDDNVLYKFKEGDFPRLNLRDIEDMLLLLVQKKLSNPDVDDRPETTRSNISKLTPYIAYKNPQGIIYQDKYKRNRLMRSDKLYKFCDGTLSSVRSVLDDIASNLEMDYLPKRHWSNLEMKRSHIMVKAIDKLLFERRLMRNLEKFVGGCDYENDLGLLERTI